MFHLTSAHRTFALVQNSYILISFQIQGLGRLRYLYLAFSVVEYMRSFYQLLYPKSVAINCQEKVGEFLVIPRLAKLSGGLNFEVTAPHVLA